jgi:hypothetical protein
LAVFTEPGTESDANGFEGRIGGEISSIFSASALYDRIKALSPQFAGAFWKFYKSGDVVAMRKFLKKTVGGEYSNISIRKTVPKAIHQASRTGTRGKVPKNALQRTLVTDPARLEKYIEQRGKKIGAAAAGYIRAAKTVPGIKSRLRDIPKFKGIGRHRKASGRVVFKKRSTGERGEVFNDVSYIKNAITKTNREAAEVIARKKMIKAFRIALRKSVKKRFK